MTVQGLNGLVADGDLSDKGGVSVLLPLSKSARGQAEKAPGQTEQRAYHRASAAEMYSTGTNSQPLVNGLPCEISSCTNRGWKVEGIASRRAQCHIYMYTLERGARTEKKGDKRTIVTPYECITVSICDCPIDVFFRLLQSYVHVPIQTRKNAYKDGTAR
jgi:hypothetical protein